MSEALPRILYLRSSEMSPISLLTLPRVFREAVSAMVYIIIKSSLNLPERGQAEILSLAISPESLNFQSNMSSFIQVKPAFYLKVPLRVVVLYCSLFLILLQANVKTDVNTF